MHLRSRDSLSLVEDDEKALEGFPLKQLLSHIALLPQGPSYIKGDIGKNRTERVRRQRQAIHQLNNVNTINRGGARETESGPGPSAAAHNLIQVAMKGYVRSCFPRYWRDVERVTKICSSAPVQIALIRQHGATFCSQEDLAKTLQDAFRSSPEAGHRLIGDLYALVTPWFRYYLDAHHTPFPDEDLARAIRFEKWLEDHRNSA